MSGNPGSLLLVVGLFFTEAFFTKASAQAPQINASPATTPLAVPMAQLEKTDGNTIRLGYRVIECPDQAAFAALEKIGNTPPADKKGMEFGLQFLSPKEQAKLLDTIQANKRSIMITSPRVTLVSGTSAKVSIGNLSTEGTKGTGPNKALGKRMNLEGINLETRATHQNGIILIESKGDFVYKDQSHHQWQTTAKLKSGESIVFSGSEAGSPPTLVIVTAETLP